MFFRLLIEKESSTLTYLLADEETRRALIIDPVLEDFERLKKLLKELKFDLIYSLETHLHADHVTCGTLLRNEYGTKLVAGKMTGIRNSDIYLDHMQILELGQIKVRALYTPGHTDGDICYVCENHVFTGDVLHFRGCGRTDFQGGSSEKLYNSIKNVLYQLPINTIVHPGHDYKGNTTSSILEEMEFNPRINKNTQLEVFKATMESLKLDPPKKIDIALPRNSRSGE